MQARYYDPVIGRFMATDPVGFTPGNPMSFNRYLYVNGNPYKYTDPTREIGNFVFGAFVGGVASAAASIIAGESGRDVIVSAFSGAVIGAVTSGASVSGIIAKGLAKTGASQVARAAGQFVVEGAVGGAAGNTSGQFANMGIDMALGQEVDAFDTSQVLVAGAIGAAGSTLPAIVAGSEAAATGSAAVSLSVTEQIGLGVAAGVQEGTITNAVKATIEVYSDRDDNR